MKLFNKQKSFANSDMHQSYFYSPLLQIITRKRIAAAQMEKASL